MLAVGPERGMNGRGERGDRFARERGALKDRRKDRGEIGYFVPYGDGREKVNPLK
jgi:hypothetical protein